MCVFTLESPVVSHVEVREAGGQDVGAVFVPMQVAATRGKGLDSDINTEFREILCTLERTVFIWDIESKLVDDMKPSRLGGLQGVEPF